MHADEEYIPISYAHTTKQNDERITLPMSIYIPYTCSSWLVYNNFPWPEKPTEKKKTAVETKAQAVLDARARHTLSTLADLYDPVSMPADLVKSHADLDRAVDQCYRSKPFTSDRQRMEFLFALYEHYTAPLLPVEKKGRRRL